MMFLSQQQKNNAEVGTMEWATAVTDLTLYVFGENWKTSELD